MKKDIISYNNISSTIRALLIAARFKKGFHEIICHWQMYYNTGKSHDDDAD